METDIYFDFFKKYERGQFFEALISLIRTPDSCYETLKSSSPYIQQLANYADSVVFGDIFDYHAAALILEKILEGEPQIHKKESRFLEILKIEAELRRLPPSVFNLRPSSQIPELYQNLVAQHQEINERIESFIEEKEGLRDAFSGNHFQFNRPWHFVPYQFPLDIQYIAKGDIPMVYIEPSNKIDYKAFLDPFFQKPVLYVCETYQHFYSMLQYDPFYEALMEPNTLLYILNIHPEDQLLGQNLNVFKGITFAPILSRKIEHMDSFFPRLAKAIANTISHPTQPIEENANTDNQMTYLYHLAKQWSSHLKAERYGKSRSLAFHKKKLLQNWNDKFKEQTTENIDLGFLPKDYVAETLQDAEKLRKPRPLDPSGKKRIVHITPQIIDGTHAPSKLLRALLYNTDREKYDPSVIVTEIFVKLHLDYPSQTHVSEPSSIRGQTSLLLLKDNDIETWIAEPALSIEILADATVKKLEEWKADIAVFHGPDEINMLVSAMTNTPIRVLFEHGTPPEYPGFDYAILSSEDALDKQEPRLKKIGTTAYALNFSLDVRKMWEKKPFSKEELGFPADAFIMTTISNHLASRLNKQMCMAIGEILKRCPGAYYAPIGNMKIESELRKYFDAYGVNNQVRFLGAKANPSQYARSMELYLNEFPFGSCIGMLEAMAAGCPVVSMYDPQGPQQARYAGAYFGIDKVIHSNRVEDYIDLACKLATDKDFYKEWSKAANEQYLKRADESAYTKQFENLITEMIKKINFTN